MRGIAAVRSTRREGAGAEELCAGDHEIGFTAQTVEEYEGQPRRAVLERRPGRDPRLTQQRGTGVRRADIPGAGAPAPAVPGPAQGSEGFNTMLTNTGQEIAYGQTSITDAVATLVEAAPNVLAGA